MTSALLVSVRFHDGRYHGAGDWPPSPARLFQALVAACNPLLGDTSRAALRWLEQRDKPVIATPAAKFGQPGFKLFMPNNDMDTAKVGGDLRKIGKIRTAIKNIRPHLFDVSVPLLYVWRFDVSEENINQARRICDIAQDLYQLGRGVDMAWAVAEVLDEAEADERLNQHPGTIYRPCSGGSGLVLDCPEDGSLKSLIDRHAANARRFTRSNGRTQFANAPKPQFKSVRYDSPATHLLFELRRTTAPGAPFAPWPLRGAAALVQALRDAACARLKPHFNGSGVVEKVLVGRDATDADKALRVRIVPLPSIGHTHADHAIRRMLVQVPPDCPIKAQDLAWSFAGLEITAPVADEETGEILASPVELVQADDRSVLTHYGLGEHVAARVWRSVTPLALRDRSIHAVVQALRHVGLRAKVAAVRLQREPFEARGERAERFCEGTRFPKHQLWHVEVEFAETISGLLVLGNGRYAGLGLMAPPAPLIRAAESVFAFSIVDGLGADPDPLALARALRRAVMARVQSEIGERKELPMFFSGHEADGSAARRGGHGHLAFVPDLARSRLLVIAPHVVEHRESSKDERDNLVTLARALAGLTELRAAQAGKLKLEAATVHPGTDPLFSVSAQWETATPYAPTRHAKRNGADSLHDDVLNEVLRRQLPKPLKVHGDGKGGLMLKFNVAVPGPVLLGKTLHYGGGLFAHKEDAGTAHNRSPN
ncbi:MAG: type I-U CRISPR-associated protein Csb2 [Solimonas sp.]